MLGTHVVGRVVGRCWSTGAAGGVLVPQLTICVPTSAECARLARRWRLWGARSGVRAAASGARGAGQRPAVVGRRSLAIAGPPVSRGVVPLAVLGRTGGGRLATLACGH